jgi:hypothetical protein
MDNKMELGFANGMDLHVDDICKGQIVIVGNRGIQVFN